MSAQIMHPPPPSYVVVLAPCYLEADDDAEAAAWREGRRQQKKEEMSRMEYFTSHGSVHIYKRAKNVVALFDLSE